MTSAFQVIAENEEARKSVQQLISEQTQERKYGSVAFLLSIVWDRQGATEDLKLELLQHPDVIQASPEVWKAWQDNNLPCPADAPVQLRELGWRISS